ncbi:MAG TPA: 50S ribosomal protein L10 [Longimicrobiales bacterium]|nr:50S ribosomal protein L10 [Longimicrobiales bacterium]
MNRTEKASFVEDLRERISRAPVVYLTDFTGLSVKSITKLRRSLRASGAEYVVVKNRLARLAFSQTELPNIFEDLDGPTGMVLGYGDVVAPAKALTDFAKDHDKKPALKLGILENKVLQPEQIVRLAKLPPREQLLAELAGAMSAPTAMLAMALEAKLQEMAGLIDALREKRQGEGG